MYDLINDVNAYAAFLPWCSDSKILSQSEQEIQASLMISYHGIHKSFSTINTITKDKRIEMRLAEGPFKSLEGIWIFVPLGDDGTKIMLDLEFEFKNKLISMSFGSVFTSIADSLMDAFIQRAAKVYG